ncbi:HalOD1 output domain-containing protein [Halomarina rubra]|uniref:HalOD1 output domain-containing protein n=1 Tax=Halomarina rubra TaxID=2071873 RepID=A0ABD6B2Q4_9EURY|nr:HalOD1 output domain-containing protein [Halomarina rubra]
MSTLQHSEEVYRAEDASPVELLGRALDDLFADTPPVYNVVDPDALNTLFEPRADGTPRVDGAVTFSYRDHEFAIDSDGEVRVEEF